MKHETNNEMDLLLRRLGRRDGDSVRGTEAQSDERHLDPDELSSYAENVLPATARARYTEHLAECASCRKLVTELSLSHGATAAAPAETIPARSGLKTFLASLFSPMVLRYAVPALGVVVVMIVGFVVLRQQRQESFVARVYDEQRPASVATKQDAAAPAASPAPGFNDLQKQADNVPQREERAGKSPSESKPQSGTVDASDAAASVPPAKDEKSAAEPQPVAASTAAPPAAPKVAAVSEEEAKKTEARKQPATPTATADNITPDGEIAKAQANEVKIAKEDKNSRRTEQQTPEREDKDKQKTSDSTGFIGGIASVARGRRRDSADDAETRSIAGRRFRKERGIWTDTAYDSSTATVNVARGSEQFRALVADEPEIGTIAKQLDGQVIVVWKGHAYRIR